jgi:glycosyltransferase involved in cell wall biosynthesis
MKKVLVISYYWPPAGGAGVQRWLKFVKYMRFCGWEPVVYTALDGEMPVIDRSLEKDIPAGTTVLKKPIWEPYSIYKKFSGRKKDERINASFLNEKKSGGLAEKLSVWIRGNFFIPDARRFWIRPSVKYLSKYVRDNGISHVISSGPPHSMHLIALGLKKKNPELKWIADFRDPWTNIDFYEKLMLSSRADGKHRRMEAEVLLRSDLVLSVGFTMNEEFKEIYKKAGGEEVSKFHVLTNGFDVADLLSDDIIKDEKFSIAHIGTLVKDRNPRALWKMLQAMVQTNKDFASMLQIKLVGKVDFFVKEQLKAHGLDVFVKYIEYLPHDEVIKEQRRSKVLLLLANDSRNAKGILTGKIFEYMATGVPVLAIGPPDGDMARVLSETNSGLISDFDDEIKLKEHIEMLFRGEVIISNVGKVNQYSRHELTKKLCLMLDGM